MITFWIKSYNDFINIINSCNQTKRRYTTDAISDYICNKYNAKRLGRNMVEAESFVVTSEWYEVSELQFCRLKLKFGESIQQVF